MSTGGLLIRRYVFEEVVIGTQIWMKKNYDFGGTYPNASETNVADYGKLYTWAEAMAINFPGWHLPTRTEFLTLIAYLGGNAIAGAHLKEVGTTHWITPNTGADNSSGFTAVGAGINEIDLTREGSFWSATEYESNTVYAYNLIVESISSFGGIEVADTNDKTARLSVRLIKN